MGIFLHYLFENFGKKKKKEGKSRHSSTSKTKYHKIYIQSLIYFFSLSKLALNLIIPNLNLYIFVPSGHQLISNGGIDLRFTIYANSKRICVYFFILEYILFSWPSLKILMFYLFVFGF